MRGSRRDKTVVAMQPEHYTSAVAVIGTDDVAGTIKYFEEILGFERDFAWGEPPIYAGVKSGGAELYITHDPALAKAIRDGGLRPDIFIWVEKIDHFYARHRAKNAVIEEELSERPWGVRQYVVRDPNGYRLKIAEPWEPDIED